MALVVAPIIAVVLTVAITITRILMVGEECYERDMWFFQVRSR